MPFPTATTSASDAASGESAINDLLSAGLDTAETEVQDVGDTPVSEPETEVQDEVETEVEQGDETEPEADEAEGEEGAEEETGEEDFNVQDLETDFAESAYIAAAKHYSKTFGHEVDPNDPKDRAFLKETMERGRKISELQSKESEEEAEESTETAAETKPQPTRTPEEMLQERITGVRAYAKETFNPVVAKEIVMPGLQAIANFFWGKEKAANVLSGRSDAELAEVTQALTSMMALQIADAVPQIVQATPQAVLGKYPVLSSVMETAEKEELVNTMADAQDDKGNPLYPGFDQLVENGAINRELAKLRESQFSKDPQKDKLEKLKIAYRLARGQKVDPQVVTKAAQRGRAAERERQSRVAAGRTSPGSSSRGNTAVRSGLLNDLVGGGESRSASLFKNVGRRNSE